MKRNFLQFVLFGLGVAIASSGLSFKNKVDLSEYKLDDHALCYNVPKEHEVTEEQLNDRYHLFLGKSYIAFKEALAFKESRGNYSVVNTFGYMGKYQFNPSTLRHIGIDNSQNFLTDTRLQEEAFKIFTARNKYILRREIKRYVGTTVNGVRVTESGILAAAHLSGAGSVKKYLRSGGAYQFEDAFGTTIRHYLKKFSGYDTSIIEPQKKINVI